MLIHVNIVFKATSQPANSELYSMKETSEDLTLNFFRKTLNWVAKFRVRLICGCGLSVGVYGNCRGMEERKLGQKDK